MAELEQNHILVIDDDTRLRRLLRRYLTENGFLVSEASHPDESRRLMDSFLFDLLVLDVMMTGENGFSFAKSLREKGNMIPILMLTAMGEIQDRIHGLESGVDDYLSKPFSPRELLVRLKIIFRRIEPVMVSDHETTTYQIKDLKIDDSKRVCSVKDKELSLTNNEYMLLAYLVKNKNISFTRENLIQNIWGYDYVGESRMIDDLVKRLRKKLKSFDAQVEITTVWGYGYRIDDNF